MCCFVLTDRNMDDDTRINTTSFMASKLLYPEVLEESDLLLMLKERHVRVEVQDLESKVSLLNLCHKNIVPRPQRNYRPNRRGQIMMQQQVKLYGESSSNPTVLRKNNFTKSLSATDDKLKRLADSEIRDRLKLSPSGDRLKPPPFSNNRLQSSPTVDRIKPPPLLVTSSGQTENKVIRLSSLGSLTSGTFASEPCNKRSAAGNDESPQSKRIHLSSSAASRNREIGISKSHEQSKSLLNNSGKAEDGSSRKFTKISWP